LGYWGKTPLNKFRKQLIKTLTMFVLVLVVFPVAYLSILDATVGYSNPRLVLGWEDNTFGADWKLASNAPVEGSLEAENGTLVVSAIGAVANQTIVTGQLFLDADKFVDLATYNYLKVSVRTSSIDVAARIVIRSNTTEVKEVLMKTYNDNEWHTEVVDLSGTFALSGMVVGVEMGFMMINPTKSGAWANFRQLSLNHWELDR
jgi:hypothetical protein